MRPASRKFLTNPLLFSLGLYALTSLIAFAPCLFAGKVYFDNDLILFNFPYRSFFRHQLGLGHFPLWNPYLFGGQPFFADPNSQACYPLNYLTLLFPVPYGLSVYFFLHMALAAMGMHLWLKSLRLSESACRVGALLFSLSAFFWWEMIHPQLLASFAWFPWLMACAENLVNRFSPRLAFLTGLCFAVLFSAGSFQSALNIFYAALAYFLFRLLGNPKPLLSGKELLKKKIFVLLLFAAWGSLPLLVPLIPAVEFSSLSTRNGLNQTYENFSATFSSMPSSTYEFLFPRLGLSPGETLESTVQAYNSPTGDNPSFGALGYLGIWIPFLIVLSFQRNEKRLAWFFLAGLLLSLLASWGGHFPLHKLLWLVLPGLSLSRAPYRFLEIYTLFAAILTAFGYEWLSERFMKKRRWDPFLLGTGIYGLLLFLVGLSKPGQTWMEMTGLILGMAGLAGWGLARAPWGAGCFAASLVLPLLLNGWNSYTPSQASNYDAERRFPAFTDLREKAQGCRYFFGSSLFYPARLGSMDVRTPFPEDMVMEFGIRSARGYNPLRLQRVADLDQLPLDNYVKLMAVHGLLFGQPAGDRPGYSHSMADSIHLYRPIQKPGYLNAPSRLRVLPNDGSDLTAMSEKNFDPTQEAVLNQPLPLPPSTRKANLHYEIQKDEPDQQAWKIQLDSDSLVTFSEVMYPGWKAFLDGRPVELLTANYAFRALAVPSGDHQVEFQYIPSWLKPLIWGMIAWLLSVMAYAAFSRPRTTPHARSKSK